MTTDLIKRKPESFTEIPSTGAEIRIKDIFFHQPSHAYFFFYKYGKKSIANKYGWEIEE